MVVDPSDTDVMKTGLPPAGRGSRAGICGV